MKTNTNVIIAARVFDWKEHCECIWGFTFQISRTRVLCAIFTSRYSKSLLAHITRKHEEKTITCSLCDKLFANEVDLKNHEKIHAKRDKPYWCMECPDRFRTSEKLKSHIEMSHSDWGEMNQSGADEFVEKPSEIEIKCEQLDSTGQADLESVSLELFQCSECSMSFTSLDWLEKHLNDHNKEKMPENDMIIKFSQGSKEFSDLKSFKLHQDSSLECGRVFQCSECKKEFPSDQALVEHTNTTHANDMKYFCDVCFELFAVQSIADQHMLAHESEKSFVCPVCDRHFERIASYRTHLNLHSINKQNNVDEVELHSVKKLHTCSHCSKPCNSLSKLKQHMIIHSEKRSYVCVECNLSFKHDPSLKKHMKTHQLKARELIRDASERALNGGKTSCAQCLEEFSSIDQLSMHQMANVECQQIYSCLECDEKFAFKTAFDSHMRTGHDDQEQTKLCCDQCPKQFLNFTKLKAHMLVHSKDRPYVCSECNATFKYTQSFRLHMKTHQPVERPFGCNQCTKKFPTLPRLKEHMSSHSSAKPHVCSVCNHSFKYPQSLRSHLKSHDEEDIYRRSKLVAHQCNICSEKFLSYRVLEMHVKSVHDPSKPIFCNICFKLYPSLGRLTEHMIVHSTERPHVCTTCNKLFKHEQSLKLHMKKHEEEKSQILNGTLPETNVGNNEVCHCKECGKMFKNNKALRAHVRGVHAEEKVFCCDQCPKTFALIGRLKDHMAVHSSDRPHACSKCDQAFKRLQALNMHMFRHHGDDISCGDETKGFTCNECSKKFSSFAHLKMHLRCHSEERPYACPKCNRTFKYTQSLNYHMKNQSCFSSKKPKKEPDTAPERQSIKGLVCPQCKVEFTDLELLKTHQNSSAICRKIYSCKFCDKQFTSRASKGSHERTKHVDETRFSCDQCFKQFPIYAQFEVSYDGSQHWKTIFLSGMQ